MGQGIISRSNPGNSGDKVGDIRITTRNTLGEKWALCNGDYRLDSEMEFDIFNSEYWREDRDIYNTILAKSSSDPDTFCYIERGIIDNYGNWYFICTGQFVAADGHSIVIYNSKTQEASNAGIVYAYEYSYVYLCKDIYDNSIWALTYKDRDDGSPGKAIQLSCLSDRSRDTISFTTNNQMDICTDYIYNSQVIYRDEITFDLHVRVKDRDRVFLSTSMYYYKFVEYNDSWLLLTNCGTSEIAVHIYDKESDSYTLFKNISFGDTSVSYSLTNAIYDSNSNKIIASSDDGMYRIIINCNDWSGTSLINESSRQYQLMDLFKINNNAFAFIHEYDTNDIIVCPAVNINDPRSGEFIIIGSSDGIIEWVPLDRVYSYHNGPILYLVHRGDLTGFVVASVKALPTISVDDESYCFIKIKD